MKISFSTLAVFRVIPLLCFCFLTATTHADTLYTYVGNAFNQFHGTDACPQECLMEGYFLISGAPPINLNGGQPMQNQFDVTPLAYAFTDGNVLANNTNSCADFFSVSTNAIGAITSWNIRLFTPTLNSPCAGGGPYTGTQLLTSNELFGMIDITLQAPAAVNFASVENPGTWSTMYVPEPNYFDVLAAFAAAGLSAYFFRHCYHMPKTSV